MSYIDQLIEERLGGDRCRLAELFKNDEILEELKKNSKDTGWYRFEEQTFDGEYLIKKDNEYICYQQDRGFKFWEKSFPTLYEAALFLFKK
ncbi:hypothetical protein [Gilvimarinus sp. 1_MG-2023]|uniref:hypothetical protein n=1 Tax=Gilvimarinus sp. 1_MG-2023 TaxID=3062638 RepID=UPI0026E26BA1|nr:hypothetical protein [Gilvimarinus sp. 1_MG-2023]MDO6747405.1 hypothetical protein [Gilvimarinus sp. 1_MG-2023]